MRNPRYSGYYAEQQQRISLLDSPENMLFVEELCMNLILPAVLADHEINTFFALKHYSLILSENKKTIGHANRDDSGLYKVD